MEEKKLYVGGISYDSTDDSLKSAFGQAGTVESATVIMDKMTGRSKGFGFVTISDDEVAKKAMTELNGKDVQGREISVSEARPMEERPERPRRNFGDRDGQRRSFGGSGRRDFGNNRRRF